jgi:hypothetical protein
MGEAEAPLHVVVAVIAPADHRFERVQLGWHREQRIHAIRVVHPMAPSRDDDGHTVQRLAPMGHPLDEGELIDGVGDIVLRHLWGLRRLTAEER